MQSFFPKVCQIFWQIFSKFFKKMVDKWIFIPYNDKRACETGSHENGSQKWRNWQTRTVQVRVVAIPCGFDSHLLQAESRNFHDGDSCFSFIPFPAADRPGGRQTGASRPPRLRLFPILFRNIRACGSAHNQCRVKYHPFRLFPRCFQLL